MMPLTIYLSVSAVLFCVGVFIVLTRRHTIMILMGIELVFNAANINLVAFGEYNPQLTGQMFALFVIMIAACEAAIGLAIVMNVYRYFRSTDPDAISDMKN